MALSTAQQAKIRLFLGYPQLYRYQNPRLEGVLQGNLDHDAETEIATCLANLATIEFTILNTAVNTAGIKRADDIEFFRGEQFLEISRLGRMYVGRISILLGVPVFSDFFSGRGYLGDSYSQFGLASGSGNIIPLG